MNQCIVTVDGVEQEQGRDVTFFFEKGYGLHLNSNEMPTIVYGLGRPIIVPVGHILKITKECWLVFKSVSERQSDE